MLSVIICLYCCCIWCDMICLVSTFLFHSLTIQLCVYKKIVELNKLLLIVNSYRDMKFQRAHTHKIVWNRRFLYSTSKVDEILVRQTSFFRVFLAPHTQKRFSSYFFIFSRYRLYLWTTAKNTRHWIRNLWWKNERNHCCQANIFPNQEEFFCLPQFNRHKQRTKMPQFFTKWQPISRIVAAYYAILFFLYFLSLSLTRQTKKNARVCEFIFIRQIN
jgi:hypothetical protein